MDSTPAPFLTAEWRNLVMLNYEVDPAVLQPYVPRGTELDSWRGRTYVSVVGFLFLQTRVLGWSIPFHTDFEELNLRFYVKRAHPEGDRRGVVFIKELVPRRAIAWAARTFYHENYFSVPMNHRWQTDNKDLLTVSYGWVFQGRKSHLEIKTEGALREIVPGSDEEFITEHYWGYARQRNGGTVEYRVEHPPWRVSLPHRASLDCNAMELYGREFANVFQNAPTSAFLADGSAVTVFRGALIS
jgi:uncharacterized protein YqjF (DUF2071 family)